MCHFPALRLRLASVCCCVSFRFQFSGFVYFFRLLPHRHIGLLRIWFRVCVLRQSAYSNKSTLSSSLSSSSPSLLPACPLCVSTSNRILLSMKQFVSGSLIWIGSYFLLSHHHKIHIYTFGERRLRLRPLRFVKRHGQPITIQKRIKRSWSESHIFIDSISFALFSVLRRTTTNPDTIE